LPFAVQFYLIHRPQNDDGLLKISHEDVLNSDDLFGLAKLKYKTSFFLPRC